MRATQKPDPRTHLMQMQRRQMPCWWDKTARGRYRSGGTHVLCMGWFKVSRRTTRAPLHSSATDPPRLSHRCALCRETKAQPPGQLFAARDTQHLWSWLAGRALAPDSVRCCVVCGNEAVRSSRWLARWPARGWLASEHRSVALSPRYLMWYNYAVC